MSTDYYALYKEAERAYSNAVDGISRCSAKHQELLSQKDEKETRRDVCNQEIPRNEKALEKVNNILGKKEDTEASRSMARQAVDGLSRCYQKTTSHSAVVNKSITEILEPHDNLTAKRMESFFGSLNDAVVVISERIDEYKKEVARLEIEIEDLKRAIATNNDNWSSYSSAKTTAEWNMAYYKTYL